MQPTPASFWLLEGELRRDESRPQHHVWRSSLQRQHQRQQRHIRERKPSQWSSPEQRHGSLGNERHRLVQSWQRSGLTARGILG